MNKHLDSWYERAEECAGWAMSIANRFDVWGVYTRYRVNGIEHKVATWPWRRDRGRLCLNLEVIRRHFKYPGDGKTMGLHSTAADNTSIWFAVDADCHGDDPDGSKAKANFTAMMAWCRKLRLAGFVPLLEDSNGAGGFHLWVFLDRPAPTRWVFAFIDELVNDFADYGLTAKPETFPKQAEVAPDQFGNWLRLPGKHHTNDHVSRFWNEDTQTWLEGHAAIDAMVNAVRNDASLIPEPVAPAAPAPGERPATPWRHVNDRALGRGKITGLHPRDTRNGQGFGLSIEVNITEQVDGSEWRPCEPLTVTGTFWLVRKDGTTNTKAAQMVAESLGLDPHTMELLDDLAPWPVQAVITLDRNTGELGLAWLRPFTASIDPADSLVKYIEKLPTGLHEGQQRSNHAFVLAAHCVHDLQLDDNTALDWLMFWNNKQAVPLPVSKLETTITNARRYGGKGGRNQ